ncbi:10173_t:CDS:2 [Dentiscutata erythropus]|uniref:10173_t:CDS:1 n=1 Tax=Dentiscutata erythropus TaxID=1348616 RepID=A0A9N9GIH4_9GLOM|nr:10173_t:CDS:2 [Dentiscutata erythropus]
MAKLYIEKGVFENAFLFSALTSDDFLEFVQKTPLNCFNLKTFITFIITKSSSHLILSPDNTLYWFKRVVYQIFSKNIAIKNYENAEREVNDFKTKQVESKHFGFWYLVGKWNLKKIVKEEFALSPHHPINLRKRIQESENRLRFAKHVKFNKFIEAVISSDLEHLPENEPLQTTLFILPDDAKIWVENSWEFLTDDLSSPNLNKLNRNIFLKYKDISITEISEESWLTDTIYQFLEAVVRDIPGLSVHLNDENRKPNRTVRLKLEDNQFEILYVEGANPELKGKKCQEDAEKLQQLIKLNLDELLRDF